MINTSSGGLQYRSGVTVRIMTSTPPIARSRKIARGSIELSPRQAAVLEGIRTLSKREKVAPTRATVLRELALKSHASVASHIQTLASRGWIEKVAGTERGLILRREGAALYEPEELRRTPQGERPYGAPPPEPTWIDYEVLWEMFVAKPDLCLRIRGDAMSRAGLADGGIVALARRCGEDGKMTFSDGDIVAARVADDVMLRRVHGIDATTVELRPESRSRKHRAIRFDTRTDEVEIIGVVIGRMLAGAG